MEKDANKETTGVMFKGRRFDVVRERVKFDDGSEHTIDKIEAGNVAVVLPIIEGKILLEEIFRGVKKQRIVEAVAGIVDEGESPENCAARETTEETGYRVKRLRPIGAGKKGAFSSPGILTEEMYFFIAECDDYVGTKQEEMEKSTRSFLVTPKEAKDMVDSNQIRDLKTREIIRCYWEDLGEEDKRTLTRKKAKRE
ncbi:MAG: NUDIX hydrolase [Candidatus Marsarchaeota archaeon]|nr:NUDIX hydrolase [Candidatus Marsarchaeota archaeon]